jgi:hypothetical protein
VAHTHTLLTGTASNTWRALPVPPSPSIQQGPSWRLATSSCPGGRVQRRGSARNMRAEGERKRVGVEQQRYGRPCVTACPLAQRRTWFVPRGCPPTCPSDGVAAWRDHLPAFSLTRRRLAGRSHAAAAWLAGTPSDGVPGGAATLAPARPGDGVPTVSVGAFLRERD